MPLSGVISNRQELILRHILEEYIVSAVPVGSEALTRRPGLGVSSATVRHEMATLEDEGYITRPHSSSGGAPTARGYRYYVESLWGVRELPANRRLAMRRRLHDSEPDVDSWTRVAARMLSDLTQNMALATFPRSISSRVRQVQLVQLHEFLVMLVLVLHEARLYKELVPLEEPVDAEGLGEVVNRLNSQISGLSRQEILSKVPEGSPFERQVLGEVLRVLEEGERAAAADYLTEGLRHLLAQPEFVGSERTVEIVEALESQRLVQAILEENPQEGEVRVLIGEESRHDALKPLGVVLGQYGVPGSITGIVGIVGPMRMEYGGTVAGVQCLSDLLSELVAGVQAPPSDPGERS